ncbi:class I mannose-6-phosphate isomerase [Aureibacter tunicatorum]|uniref:Mannose-6-phosphate isomerase class I n=1 Tax=Aureibacter tunicatorum TaxID=866807 RepID=A0AAE3XI87_9BACT|nr:class I mannose-6-phosphate isomerase [Aureibacter tunicatorum]MDR6237287.1 mannose-6-phosphate isomerase class I [Aureibacter tunicatorum]BDD06278.1 mannose-6-phosphate isomerase [Aureibacter tunicatorum]
MLTIEESRVKYAKKSNYDKLPNVELNTNDEIFKGWPVIVDEIKKTLNKNAKNIIVVETYQGVLHEELIEGLQGLEPAVFVNTMDLFKDEDAIKDMTWKDVTDDRVFGYMTRLDIQDFFDADQRSSGVDLIESAGGDVLVYGPGASSLVEKPTVLLHVDMARWNIQLRMRANKVTNLGMSNSEEAFSEMYKRGFFVDWRVCDRVKKDIYSKVDYFLDTNIEENPKMLSGQAIRQGLDETAKRPFRVVPFFDPGPWGGQWMKDVCDLDREVDNFAWCFDCVPEENSLMFKVGEDTFEIPSVNLVFQQPRELLGDVVYARFGDEFPIRFDFLDTMEGGNLSLQVHPTTEYIQQEFGMNYTQDESYYMLDTDEEASVYIGVNKGINPKEMIHQLHEAQAGNCDFDADKFVNKIPVKKHDHILIPNGTVHCSGTGGMVLEISATPYIFTFKLWDWGRLGLDGKPRPINVERGEKVINWDRDEDFVQEELYNDIRKVAEGDGWLEERTGLHKTEFIETRRHWFSKPVIHDTNGIVNVLNLVEGQEAIVESPTDAFEPFVVHYAETFIVPAQVGQYIISPYGESEGKKIATIKAFVRG